MSTASAPAAAKSDPFVMPAERQCPYNPPTELAALRNSQPLSRFRFPDGRVGWLVTSHELAREIMGDLRISRGASGSPLSAGENQSAMLLYAIQNDESFPAAARAAVERYQDEGRIAEAWWDPLVARALHDHPLQSMPYSNTDAPKHARMRRMLTGHFTVKSVNKHRELIERIVEECLDDIENAGPPADFVAAFTFLVPSKMSCAIIGVPESDRLELESLMAVRAKPGVTAEEVLVANEGLRRFARNLIELRRTEPGDDVISEVIRNGDMTDDELTAAAILLELAAVLTTSSTLASGLTALLRDRTQWDMLVAGSVETGRVVEEMLRFTTAIQAAETRTALEDVEIGGVVIKAYERIAISLAAANRDPAVFDDPDTFDVNRQASKHITFGHGIHQCLGQQLVRLELQIALTALARRFPTLDLAIPESEVAWPRADVETYGPTELPLTW